MSEERSQLRLPRLVRRRTLDVTVDVKPEPVDLAAELHKAKEEVAKELEANLKQLKQVMRETERIAKDMELVLHSAKNPMEDDRQEDQKHRRHGKEDLEAKDDDPTPQGARDQDDADEEWDPLDNG